MKIKGSSYFLLVIMIIMLVMIGFSLKMKYFESKFLPLLLCSVVFILSAVELGREISAEAIQQKQGTEGDKNSSVSNSLGWRDYLPPGAWVFGLFFGIYLLGFVVVIPLFIFSYLKSHDTSWHEAIIYAILTPLLVYGIFERGLGVILYRGLLFGLL
jgi:hypothetical protein